MRQFIFILLLTCLFIQCKKKAIEADYFIENINIVHVESGEISANQYVAITDRVISGIYDQPQRIASTCVTVNGTGQYLIPGLWDMHTHYSWNNDLSNKLLIANGVIGIREMWGDLPTINTIKSNIESDNIAAPDIYTAGNIIDGPQPIWPGSAAMSSVEDVDKELTAQASAGADFYKVYSLLPKDVYLKIAERSKTSGIPFAGHIPMSVNIWDAIQAGQQSTEHLYGVLEACSDDGAKLDSLSKADYFGAARMDYLVDGFNPALFDSLSRKLAQSESWICPTLTVLKNIAHLDDSTLMEDPRLAYTPAFMKRMWNPKFDFRFASRGPAFYRASKKQYLFQQALLGKFAADGVKILAGTDYSNPYCYPGFSLHDELALLVDGGLTPLQALQAATINPAVFMKKEAHFGTVQKAKQASLVLLKENPLLNIKHTTSISGVFLRGKYYGLEGIKDLLEEAKRQAAETGT